MPGWHRWAPADPSRFNGFMGDLRVRLDAKGHACVRMLPAHRHANMAGNLHGGALLGFADVALFAAARIFGVDLAGEAVTLDLSAHFIGPGRIDEPLDAEVELLRETGRLLFLRGLAVQHQATILSFSATIRKASAAK